MNRKIVRGTSPNEDKLIAVYESIGKDKISVFSKKGFETLPITILQETRKKPRSATYIFIKKDRRDKNLKEKNIQEQYDIIIEEAEKLLTLTKGKINLYRTGSASKTALQLFYDLCNPQEHAQIQPFETEIIEKCYNGALIFAKPYEGKGYKYDICSQYPSILRDCHVQWPIDEGELITLTQNEIDTQPYFKFGMYHAEVTGADYRLFKTSKSNWYTQICLARAKELKYQITIINDGKPNALLYNKFVNGAKLFRPFVDYLFRHKKNGHSYVKRYLNCLAGALCQTKSLEMTVTKDDAVYENKIMTLQKPAGDDLDNMFSDNYVVTLNRNYNFYEHNFARMKCFLVARARAMISRILEKNVENVVHCHTDGFLLSKRIHKEQKLGTDIGDLKFEGKFKNCTVKNSVDFKMRNLQEE